MRFVGILLLVAVLAACGAELDESLTSLKVGDCVDSGALGEITEIETVDCGAGTLKVIGKIQITGYGDDFPGEAVVETAANEECPPIMTQYLVPTKDSWEKGDDREIICFE
jgi:hypothetical protein